MCMIKLVEAVGILLGVPPSQEKSKYKAPMPSNYDATINLLDENYGGYLTEVARMRSESLGNKVANELFAKTLEPGFDYEQAVNDGGLAARDLFNAIQLVMMSLVADNARICLSRLPSATRRGSYRLAVPSDGHPSNPNESDEEQTRPTVNLAQPSHHVAPVLGGEEHGAHLGPQEEAYQAYHGPDDLDRDHKRQHKGLTDHFANGLRCQAHLPVPIRSNPRSGDLFCLRNHHSVY